MPGAPNESLLLRNNALWPLQTQAFGPALLLLVTPPLASPQILPAPLSPGYPQLTALTRVFKDHGPLWEDFFKLSLVGFVPSSHFPNWIFDACPGVLFLVLSPRLFLVHDELQRGILNICVCLENSVIKIQLINKCEAPQNINTGSPPLPPYAMNHVVRLLSLLK